MGVCSYWGTMIVGGGFFCTLLSFLTLSKLPRFFLSLFIPSFVYAIICGITESHPTCLEVDLAQI